MLNEDQANVATVALAADIEQAAALAGSAALMAHGLVDRPTQDIDLFLAEADRFDRTVERIASAWDTAGFDVTPVRRSPTFARFLVATAAERVVEVDIALDWRADAPIATTYGPTLSLRDAVASKVDALYGRNAARDRYDVAAILTAGINPDTMLAWAKDRDPGIEDSYLLHALRTPPRRGELDPETWTQLNARLEQWADQVERAGHRRTAFPEQASTLGPAGGEVVSDRHNPDRNRTASSEGWEGER